RLLGVQTSNFEAGPGQLDLLEPARDGLGRNDRWQKVLAAADHLRDKFGESTIGLATGMKGGFRERTHENPVGLPGKSPEKDRNKNSTTPPSQKITDKSQ
ncbi:MAG: hypothetical protein WBV36_25630, partial [Terriglobales bacterium]